MNATSLEAGAAPAYVVRLTTTSETAAVVDELLAAVNLHFSLWDDADDNRAVFSFYAADDTDAGRVRSTLAEHLQDWREFLADDLELAEPAELPREDWAESWKKHFRCTQISERIVVTPSWERDLAPDVPAVVEIDPGMAFGTGLHGTSKACLMLLDEATPESPDRHLYDVGCGTGILAIAAAKLGWPRVCAIDLCADAVAASIENAENNNCADRIEIAQANLAKWEPGGTSPLVLVNVLAPVIVEHSRHIAGWVAEGGKLVVSGILTEQFDGVVEVFAELGFELERQVTIDKWTSGRLRRSC